MVFGHITGSFETKEPHMKKYAATAKGLLKEFKITWFVKNRLKGQPKSGRVIKGHSGGANLGMWLEPLPRKTIDTKILPKKIENN